MGKVKKQSKQSITSRMREEKERVLSENIWFPSSKGPFPGLERPLWQTCVMPSERGAHLHQPQRGRSRNPGATWGPCWPSPKQRNAWPQGGHFDAGNHFKGKDEDLKHTQKHVNVLSATKISKKPGVWMSQSDPLQKIISCLRVNEIDPIEVSAL